MPLYRTRLNSCLQFLPASMHLQLLRIHQMNVWEVQVYEQRSSLWVAKFQWRGSCLIEFLYKVRISGIVTAECSIYYIHPTCSISRGQGPFFLVLQAPNWRMRSVTAWKCSRGWWESTQSIFWASRCCLSLATSSPCEGCPAPRAAHSWSTTWRVKPIGVWGSVAPSSSLAHLQ